MACRCSDMRALKKQMDDLNALLEKSSTFNMYNDKAIAQLEKGQTNSWSATKSTSVESDVTVMPSMTDLIEEAHDSVVDIIKNAIIAMGERYSEYEAEDTLEHENEMS